MAKFTGHPITDDSALGGSVIERSLRFNNDDSTYLNRTPGSESTRRAVTLSVWLKRCNFGEQMILDAYINDSHRTRFMIDAGNRMQFFTRYSGNDHNMITNAIQRDVSGWYHFVYAINTNESTASNRVKCYINGEQQTFTGSNYPDQEDLMFGAICSHTIGTGQDSGGNETFYDGYMAEMHCIDGTQLDPTYFGYTDSQTGLWRPKKYTYGNYGTNGFYLNFKDNSSTSTLGKDTSGNGNNFTPNNFSVTAGDGNDSLEDTPTNNFATFNSLIYSANTLSDGNLKVTCTSSTPAAFHSTLGVSSGKYYMEFLVKSVNNYPLGISGYTNHPNYYSNGDEIGFWIDDELTRVFRNGSNITSNSVVVGNFETGVEGSSTGWAVNDIAGLALDMDEERIYLYKGSTQVGYVDFSGFNYEKVFFGGGNYISGNVYIGNFGQRPFSHTPPSGYKTVNSKNLPLNVPSIIRPQKHFESLIYTGDGTAIRSISGLEFKPDLVWIKNRSQTDWHIWSDVVRGFDGKTLYSNRNDAEYDASGSGEHGYISAVHDHGFVVKDDDGSVGGNCNANSENYVAWCWKAGGAAVSNSDGSITTSISANQEAGFSIVTYTGTGSAATIGHGLGKAPKVVLTKLRDTTTQDWFFMPGEITNDRGKYIKFNAQDAIASDTNVYPNTATTSTVYSIGTDNAVNGNGSKYVSYCWSEIPGYSKFGTYTGNGNADGPYAHLGFRPAWLLLRGTHADIWYLYDNKRNTFNVVDKEINPNRDQSEASFTTADFLSNGFKIRTSNSSFNYNNYTYLYMAFAEQPGTTPFNTFANAR